MRLSLHEAYIAREFGVDKPLLETLVDSRLLRAEPFLRGGYTYELSHDRLVPAVLGARVPRREAETREEALRLKAEAEKARQHIRTMRMLLTAALLALAVAVGGVWYAAQKSREAVKALNNYRQAQAAKERIAFDNLASRTRIILDAGGCPAGLFAEMQQIASAHVDSAGLNAQLRTLQQQNPDCR